MDGNTPLETERKFLIRMPGEDFLTRGTVWHITQTYLTPTEYGGNRRVRRAESRGEVVYTCTSKVRKTQLTCYEEETKLDEGTYLALLRQARPDSAPVSKVRHAVPYAGHLLEVDVYPFWTEYAVLEVELMSEEEQFELPPEITVLREITAEPRYKNTNIARWLFSHAGEPVPID